MSTEWSCSRQNIIRLPNLWSFEPKSELQIANHRTATEFNWGLNTSLGATFFRPKLALPFDTIKLCSNLALFLTNFQCASINAWGLSVGWLRPFSSIYVCILGACTNILFSWNTMYWILMDTHQNRGSFTAYFKHVFSEMFVQSFVCVCVVSAWLSLFFCVAQMRAFNACSFLRERVRRLTKGTPTLIGFLEVKDMRSCLSAKTRVWYTIKHVPHRTWPSLQLEVSAWASFPAPVVRLSTVSCDSRETFFLVRFIALRFLCSNKINY